MRPAHSTARLALEKAINAGAVGTFVALATVAGVPVHRAQATLKEMARAGHCAPVGYELGTGRAGARRALYGPAANSTPYDALAHVRRVWR